MCDPACIVLQKHTDRAGGIFMGAAKHGKKRRLELVDGFEPPT